MHDVYFYKDKYGNEPVLEYLLQLADRKDKNSRMNYDKIGDYIEILRQYGTQAGEPFVKHIEGDIWELRPVRNRILFVTWYQGSYVLLHSFVKKTQKTPRREIEKARREIADMKERGVVYE